METKPYTYRFWAKSAPGNRGRIHLLEHHLADVGACFEELLKQPTIRRRLAHAGGWDDLDATTQARLCVFAALHDIGKVNVGFQTRVRGASHVLDMAPVVNGEDTATAEAFFDALGWWWDATETWDDCGGETVCGLMIATLSHHGRPLQLDGARAKRPRFWQATDELDPQEYVARVGRLLREWFPKAFAPGGEALPAAPEFQHHFLGLCNLHDAPLTEPLVIIESETGSGKTEAALWRFARI